MARAVGEAMQRLSIVIPNYNYGRFVREAVESALAVDWPSVEVIVVDDGSTDDSLKILAGFGDRIRLMTQENSGPRVACNRGFAASCGDAVIFLDSDDVLDPLIAREAARVWRPGVSKVQVQMQRIDADGRSAGRAFPAYPRTPSPEQVRGWISSTGHYPTPPGSGNVYARTFLEKILPLDDRCGDATDSACLAAAPYLGDVLTVPRPLVRYRVHGSNRSSLIADQSRFTRQLERAYQRHLFAMEVCGRAGEDDASRLDQVKPLLRGRHLLQMRVAEYRISNGDRPIPTDSGRRMLRDSAANMFSPGPESSVHRIAVAAWCLATLLAPRPLARRLIAWRFR